MNNENEFVCTICKKMFHAKENLISHQVVHVEIRPLKCDECGLTFKWKISVKEHMKFHFEREKIQCEICDE